MHILFPDSYIGRRAGGSVVDGQRSVGIRLFQRIAESFGYDNGFGGLGDGERFLCASRYQVQMDIPGVIAFVFIDGDADSNSSGFSRVGVTMHQLFAPGSSSAACQALPAVKVMLLTPGCEANVIPLAKKFSLSGAGVMESVKLSSSEQAVNKLATSPRKKEKYIFS